MYILSGKGSVAGADLANYIVRKCQRNGVLWDNHLPEYTLDFLTQLPSVSKSIRENDTDVLISAINARLEFMQEGHENYMLLCFTAHKLIPFLNTQLKCISLVDLVLDKLSCTDEAKVAFLGTMESLPAGQGQFVVLDNHQELIGDLITAVKRGYAELGVNYAGGPKKILEKILNLYRQQGVSRFLLACTDLHACKKYLMEMGVDAGSIIDVIELAGDEIIKQKGWQYTVPFLDDVSDAKNYFRYKYLSGSDSPKVDIKTQHFHQIMEFLPGIKSNQINILDVGGSSSGHSITLANKFLPSHSYITLQDISLDSLNEARSLYEGQKHITTLFEHGNIESYQTSTVFDVVLCLGVLICISHDEQFERIVCKMSSLMKAGGFLIARDGLTSEENKIYMSFGGVVRNEQYYKSVFERHGLYSVAESNFVIEEPIYRDIRTILWKKTE